MSFLLRSRMQNVSCMPHDQPTARDLGLVDHLGHSTDTETLSQCRRPMISHCDICSQNQFQIKNARHHEFPKGPLLAGHPTTAPLPEPRQ